MKLGTRSVSACLIALCLTLIVWTANGQKTKVTRPVWEYKMVIVSRTSTQTQDIMNQNGTEGWELVQVRFPGNDGNDLVLLFKRPK